MTKDYVFVVNPKGANGYTGKEWKRLFPMLTARLSKDCTAHEALTSGPSHAVEIAREAIKNGASAVIAVGGDGTLNEVVNGFFEDGKLVESKDSKGLQRTALGLIPLGTGSDFARTFGWKNDPLDAFDRIAKGRRQRIDVGCVKTEQLKNERYFINVADLHLSAKAGYFAAKYKRFGNLCYVLGALRGFIGHKNQDLRMQLDEGDWREMSQVTAMAVGNAKYFGGGMKITPGASPSNRDFEIVTLQHFDCLSFILNLHRLYNGTHPSVKNVFCERARKINVCQASNHVPKGDEVFVQADGEHVGFLPATFSRIPGAIDLLV